MADEIITFKHRVTVAPEILMNNEYYDHFTVQDPTENLMLKDSGECQQLYGDIFLQWRGNEMVPPKFSQIEYRNDEFRLIGHVLGDFIPLASQDGLLLVKEGTFFSLRSEETFEVVFSMPTNDSIVGATTYGLFLEQGLIVAMLQSSKYMLFSIETGEWADELPLSGFIEDLGTWVFAGGVFYRKYYSVSSQIFSFNPFEDEPRLRTINLPNFKSEDYFMTVLSNVLFFCSFSKKNIQMWSYRYNEGKWDNLVDLDAVEIISPHCSKPLCLVNGGKDVVLYLHPGRLAIHRYSTRDLVNIPPFELGSDCKLFHHHPQSSHPHLHAAPGSCRTSFHPVCAREAKHRMEIRGKLGSDEVELRAFSSKHSEVQYDIGSQDAGDVSLTADLDRSKLNDIVLNGEDLLDNTGNLEACPKNEDAPITPAAKYSVDRNDNGDVNASSALNHTMILKKLIDLGKVSIEDVASEVGFSPDSLNLMLTNNHIVPELQNKLLGWLKNYAHVNKPPKTSKVNTTRSKDVADVAEGVGTEKFSISEAAEVDATMPFNGSLSNGKSVKQLAVSDGEDPITVVLEPLPPVV